MSRRRLVLRRVAPALVVLATAAMLAACGDDDDDTSPTSTAAPTTVVTPEPSAPTTTAVTSEVVASTAAPTSAPTDASSVPPSTAVPPLVALSGETLQAPSTSMTNPFMLERVGVFGGLVVYDGESVDGDFALRCVAVGHEGKTSWSEWCALPGDSSSFVVVEDINPWVVDVGIEHLDVTMTQMPSDWAVTSSGCVDPLVTLIDAADVDSAVVTAIVCAGDEAILSLSGVYMQPGSGDGTTVLLTKGDEGWNRFDYGTSLSCSGYDDGIDRCALFGVDEELSEALSPIPSPAHIPAQQNYVAVRDVDRRREGDGGRRARHRGDHRSDRHRTHTVRHRVGAGGDAQRRRVLQPVQPARGGRADRRRLGRVDDVGGVDHDRDARGSIDGPPRLRVGQLHPRPRRLRALPLRRRPRRQSAGSRR